MSSFYHRWIVLWCWAVIGIGAVFAMAAVSGLRAPSMLFLDLVFWPLDGQPASLTREAIFSTALTGALTVGWGVLMLRLVTDPSLNQNPRLWQHITTALAIWFVVDSLASIVSGATVNVLSNVALLLGWLIPVLKSGARGPRSPQHQTGLQL